MSLNRRRNWIIATLLLAVMAVGYSPAKHVILMSRMLLVLRSLAGGSTGEEHPVEAVKIRRRVNGRDLDAILYQRVGSAAKRAIVVVPGISERGCYHPQLVALSRSLAAINFLVLTPDVERFRRFEISAEPIDEIAFWYKELRSMAETRGVARVGLAGISFSGTLALMVAGRPDIRDTIAFVLAIGAYHKLQNLTQEWFAAGPVTVAPGQYPTRFYARWIIMLANLPILDSEEDRRFLQAFLLDLLLQNKVSSSQPHLTPEGRRWYRLAIMREDESDSRLVATIVGNLHLRLYQQLDPAQSAREVRCPVFLIHGSFDDLIAPQQSRDLKRSIVRAESHLLVTPFLTHTHPSSGPLSWWERLKALCEALGFLHNFARVVS